MPYALQIPLLDFEQILEVKPNERLWRTFSFLSDELDRVAAAIDRKESRGRSGRTPGRTGYSTAALLRALLAMFILQIPNRAQLAVRLAGDPRLAWTCGFDPFGRTPSEATLSRLFERLSEVPDLVTEFHTVVVRGKKMGCIGDEAAAIDSSHVHAYESAPKPLTKAEKEALATPVKPLRDQNSPPGDVGPAEVGRPEPAASDDSSSTTPSMGGDSAATGVTRRPQVVEELATAPAWGAKRNPRGNVFYWFGYKLHAVVDTLSELPVDFCVTGANIHDAVVLLPLLRSLQKNSPEVTFRYHVADKAYDAREIYETVRSEFQAQAVIPLNLRAATEPPVGFTHEGIPVCTAGLPMVPWGAERTTIKFRCPEAAGKGPCPIDMHCSDSPYGYTIKRKVEDDARRLSIPLRTSRKYERLMKKRTAVERLFSRTRGHLQMDNVKVRGIEKVRTHMTLMLLALVASTLAEAAHRAKVRPLVTKAA